MDNKGYSLMELMTVVVIIGIMAAVAAPNMSGWLARRELNSSARNLAGHLQLARSEAVKDNIETAIVFADHGYTIKLANQNVGIDLGDKLSIIQAFTENSTGFNGRGLSTKSGRVNVRHDPLVDSLPSTASSMGIRAIDVTLGGGISILP